MAPIFSLWCSCCVAILMCCLSGGPNTWGGDRVPLKHMYPSSMVVLPTNMLIPEPTWRKTWIPNTGIPNDTEWSKQFPARECCYYDTAPITATMKTRTVLAVVEPKVGIYQNENVGMTHDNRSTKWSIYTWQRGSHCVWFFNSPRETWRSRKVMVFCIIPISS